MRNKITLKYNVANKIVCDYFNQYGINSLTNFFKQYANVYQFVYSTLFPRYFCRIDNDAIQSRCVFETAFVNFKARKNGFNLNIKPENVTEQQVQVLKLNQKKKKKLEKIIKNWIKILRSIIKDKNEDLDKNTRKMARLKLKNNIISILLIIFIFYVTF